MKVTAVVPQKRDTQKYNIFIDGEYRFALPMQDVLYFRLKEGNEVSEDTVEFILDSLVYVRAQDTALHYIGYKMRTAAEIERKLSEKEFSAEVIEKVMGFLKKYGYADDREYCRKYIRERLRLHPRSAYVIRMELRQKGVRTEDVDAVFSETVFDEAEDAYRLLEKRARGMFPTEEKKKNQLLGFLQRKGYSWDIISEAFSRLEQEYGGGR